MGVTLRRRTVWAAVALCVSSAVIIPPARAVVADYSLAADTYAGSQIARHEPADGMPRLVRSDGILGHDVSSHQGDVDWPAAWASGGRFVYVKATEGSGYTNPRFAQQYNGSYA